MFNWLRRLFNRSTENHHGPTLGHNHEFIVIGLGRFGASVALTLHEMGHDVVAVDVDEQIVQRLANQLPHTVRMDTTNKEGLLELGVENFDTGIVCVGSDFESNLLATVLLRQLGVRRVICKARTRTQRDILLTVGADEVILPEHEAGIRLARKLGSQGFVDFMEVDQDISVVELVAPKRLVGRSLSKSNLREKHAVNVVAIRRNKGVITPPTPDEIIRGDDSLIVIGQPDACDKILREG